MSDPLANLIIRQVKSLGYDVNTMTFLLETGRKTRFTAWPSATNPGGLYRGGEVYQAEAATEHEAAVRLAELVGIELVDG